ncbi:MAG: hypothetical protein IJ958_05645, partial [Agathobacter sp.]|nr:hypothetical protein [Agathobacter sp.]
MNKKTIVSILLCILISSIMISPIAVAGDTTNPNNWSTSDVRTFLNGIDNSSGYASYFTDAEYGVILPKTIGTNGSTSNDRFYLPGYVNAHVISWKTEEVNISSVNENISYIIPKAYWAEVSGSGGNWLRSAQENSSDGVFIYGNTDIVQVMTVDATVRGIAPLFHINMEKVIFASSASAADLLDLNGSGNANSENIPGWENFGKATTGNMPVYGMYLKTEDTNKNFKVNSVEYSNGKLNLQYENADVGKAIVIQMYSVDSLSTGCTFYGAASKIKNASGTCTIDFSNSGTPSFDNLVMQVWMENPGTGVSMAPATEPQSFSFIDGRFTETTPSIKNLRVFAMKDELACSWGDYTADGYDASQIITGGINSGNYYGFDLNISGTQMGPYATNQKIYFGTDTDGKPLVHWIAGRENTTGSMCLYQARVVDKRTFKGGSIHEQQGFSFANGINTDTVLSCSNLVSSNIVVSTSGGNGDGAITYQSSNPYVASVNEISGVVTIKNPGTFEILATKKNSSGYYDVTTRSGKIVVEDHSYSQFQDESGTHLKKCTQENCNSIVSHTPNYVVDGDVHKCSYDNCTITHDVEWEETTGDVHKCSYENCDITHDIEWEESTAGVHKCSHDNCAITHDIEWEESTAGVHKCSHENCTITHDIEWEESTGDVPKCSHENCTITHDIEWEEATGDVHKCSHENCTITHDIEWEESTGDVHKCGHDNCDITHDIEWEESTGDV